jgi:hypothetical protein
VVSVRRIKPVCAEDDIDSLTSPTESPNVDD